MDDPEAHGVHMALSAVAEPLVKRCPAGQAETEWLLHAASLVVSEKEPGEQVVHFASSAVVVPGVKPCPEPHEVIEWPLHAVASFVAEKVPDVQEEQDAATDTEPGLKPWLAGHEVIGVWHAVSADVVQEIFTPSRPHVAHWAHGA